MAAKYLIINADDYGLCREISAGILSAHDHGVVTSVSVVSVGRYFAQGCAGLKSSGLDVGLHLTFVDQEQALTGPIRGLTDADGVFLKDKTQVIPRIVLSAFDRIALRRELFAQADRLAQAGFNISHIDAHQHLHLLPFVDTMVMDIARCYNIAWIRIPHSTCWDIKGSGLNILGSRLRRRSALAGLRHTDRCLGFDFSGHTRQSILLDLLDGVGPGISELIMHPGYDASNRYDWRFEWSSEREALTSRATRTRIKALGINLTNFNGVA